MSAIAKVGKRGTLVIPAEMRRRLGLEEGALVIMEDDGERLAVRPAVAIPLEIYTRQRKAAFLLQNAVDEKDYNRAVREVRKLGLDPSKIPHARP